MASRVPGPVGRGRDARGRLQPGRRAPPRRCRTARRGRADRPSGSAARSRRRPPSEPERVDERVDQVAVAVAPPQQDRVHDVVVVLVDEGAARRLLDRDPQVVVAVLVPPELLDDLALLERQPGGQLSVLLRGVRGRAHEQVPSRRAGPGARLVWRVVHRSGPPRCKSLPDSRWLVSLLQRRSGRRRGARPRSGGDTMWSVTSARDRLPLINAGLPTPAGRTSTPRRPSEWRRVARRGHRRARAVPRPLPHAAACCSGPGSGRSASRR